MATILNSPSLDPIPVVDYAELRQLDLQQQALDHEKMYLDAEGYVAGLPAPQKTALDSWLSWSPDRKGDIQKSINRGYIGDFYGLPDEALGEGGYQTYRDRYAKEVLGVPQGGELNEDSFFELMKQKQQTQKDYRETADYFTKDAAKSAFVLQEEDRFAEAARVEKDTQAFPSLNQEQGRQLLAHWVDRRMEFEDRALPLRPLARQIYGMLSKGKEDRLSGESQAGIEGAIDQLAMLDPEDRGIVVAMLKSQGGTDSTGAVIDKALVSAQRGLLGQLRGYSANTTRNEILMLKDRMKGELLIPDGLPMENVYKSMLGMPSLGAAENLIYGNRPATDEEKAQLTAIADKAMTRADVAAQAIGILEGTIDPVKTENTTLGRFVQRTAIDVGTSIGAMAPIVLPYAGLIIAQGGYADQEYQKLREEGNDPATAQKAAQITGAVQAGIERAAFLFNFVPSSTIARVTASRAGSGLMGVRPGLETSTTFRVLSKMGTIQAAEYGEEIGQAAAPIFTGLLGEKLGWSMAEQSKFQGEISQFKEEGGFWRPEVFLAVAALSVFGGGYSGIKDSRQAQEALTTMLGDQTKLEAFGIAPAKAAEIVAMPEAERKAAYVAEYPNRNVQTAGAIAAQQQVAAQVDAEIAQGQEELNQMQAAGVSITRSADGFNVVDDTDGTAIPHATAEEAMTTVRAIVKARGMAREDTFLDALGEFTSMMQPGRTIQLSNKSGSLLQELEDATTQNQEQWVESIWDRADQERKKVGMEVLERDKNNPDSAAALDGMIVLGRSKTEAKGNVARSISLVLREGRTLDLVEEQAENDLREAVNAGNTSLETMRGIIERIEKSTGDKYLLDNTENGITEAWSSLVRLYTTGTRKGKGNKITAGARSEMASSIRFERQRLRSAETAGVTPSAFAKMREYLDYLKGIMGQVYRLQKARDAGLLDDLEAMIRESVGLKEQDALEAKVAEAVPTTYNLETGQGTSTFGYSISAKRDADYMAAVESGDVATQQAMVDEAAKAAGYNVAAWHGTPNGGFVTFNTQRNSIATKSGNTADPNTFLGAHFAEEESVARRFMDELYGAADAPRKPQLYGVYLRIKNPLGGDALSPGNIQETKRILADHGPKVTALAEQLKIASDDLYNKTTKANIDVPVEILKEQGITAWVNEKKKREREAFPEDFAEVERMTSELDQLKKSLNPKSEVTLPNGKVIDLEGPRGLVGENQFGMDILSDVPTGRNAEAEKSKSADRAWRQSVGRSMRKNFDASGFDAILYNNSVEGGVSIIIPRPEQIKSADPITFDESGNVIPLSQRFNPESANIGYSIKSIAYLKDDTRFEKLKKEGRVETGVSINDFIGKHLMMHAPDNAFTGTITLNNGKLIIGKGGAYYPSLFANQNYFWASTKATAEKTANHLNLMAEKNGGKIYMALVSSPVEKLFSSTTMATGAVHWFESLSEDKAASLSKKDLNTMLGAASELAEDKDRKFSTRLNASTLAKNLKNLEAFFDPTTSTFGLRKSFVEELAKQVETYYKDKPKAAAHVAQILADAQNKHAGTKLQKGRIAWNPILQGIGNALTEPFLRTFQEHGNGRVYAIIEVDGPVEAIASTEHESYPFAIVPVNRKSKVKLSILDEAMDWQDIIGDSVTGQYTSAAERKNYMPTGGMSVTRLKVLGPRPGTVANQIGYSITTADRHAEYLKARESGNRNVAQRLVNQEAGVQSVDASIDRNGAHSPSGPEDGAPIWDATANGIYPDDIYTQAALRYYGTGDDAMDREAHSLIQSFRGNPNRTLKVYRALEKDGPKKIQPGEWVTTVRAYAKEHGMNALNGDYKIISETVHARDIFTSGDSWAEWGYHPQPAMPVAVNRGTDPTPLSLEQFQKLSQGSSYSITTAAGLENIKAQLDKVAIDPDVRFNMMQRASENLAKMVRDIGFRDDVAAAATDAGMAQMEQQQATALAEVVDRYSAEEQQRLRADEEALKELKAKHETALQDLSVKADIEAGGAQADGWTADQKDALKVRQRLEQTTLQARQRAEKLALETKQQKATDAAKAKERQEVNLLKQEQAAQRKANEQKTGEREQRATMLDYLAALDTILMPFPAEVRNKVGGFVSLAGLRTNASMNKYLKDRVEKLNTVLETYLRKDYAEQIKDLIKKGDAKRASGKKPGGKLGAEGHALFDAVKAAAGMSEEETNAVIMNLSDAIEKARSDDPDAVPVLAEKLQAAVMFGDLNGKTRTARDLANALKWLKENYERERTKWRMQEEAWLAEITRLSDGGVVSLGGSTTDSDRLNSTSELGEFRAGSSGFSGAIRALFGKDAELFKRWTAASRRAIILRTTEFQALQKDWRDLKDRLYGKGWKGDRKLYDDIVEPVEKSGVLITDKMKKSREVIPVSVAENILAGKAPEIAERYTDAEKAEMRVALDANVLEKRPKDTISLTRISGSTVGSEIMLSQGQAMHISLMWRQAQGRAPMEAHGYTEETIEQVEAFMSPEAKAIRDWIASRYTDEWGDLNAVFARMFGVNLPQIDNYSPLTFWSQQRKELANPDPSGGPIMAQGGMSTGMFKERVEKHGAEPRIVNAVDVFFDHMRQVAHFKAFAELAREMRAVMSKPEIRRSLAVKHGKVGTELMDKWMDAMEQGGLTQKPGWFESQLSNMGGARAVAVLAWNFKSAFTNVLNLLGMARKMPPDQYLKGLARLFTGRLNWWVGKGSTFQSSEIIQRRINSGMSPEMQAGMSRIANMRPSMLKAFMEGGMALHAYSDAIFTSGSVAIAYDFHLREFLKDKTIAPEEAQRMALAATEQSIADVTQPTEFLDKSTVEMERNAMARAIFSFQSDPRQKMALQMEAYAEKDWGRLIKLVIVDHVVTGLIMQTITNAWRDVNDDDDGDELFDPLHWQWKDYMIAMAIGPWSALPMFGPAIDAVGAAFKTGPAINESILTSAGSWAGRGVRMATSEKGKVEPYEMTSDVIKGTAIGTAIMTGDARFAVVARVGSTAFDLLDNYIETADESAAHELKMRRLKDKELNPPTEKTDEEEARAKVEKAAKDLRELERLREEQKGK